MNDSTRTPLFSEAEFLRRRKAYHDDVNAMAKGIAQSIDIRLAVTTGLHGSLCTGDMKHDITIRIAAMELDRLLHRVRDGHGNFSERRFASIVQRKPSAVKDILEAACVSDPVRGFWSHEHKVHGSLELGEVRKHSLAERVHRHYATLFDPHATFANGR